MYEPRPQTALIIVGEKEFANCHPVWGTGGWLSADEREALDWLTLCRLMGWQVTAISQAELSNEILEKNEIQWIIFADAPGKIENRTLELLERPLHDKSIAFLCRIDEESPLISSWAKVRYTFKAISGTRISGHCGGEQISWNLKHSLSAQSLQPGDEEQTLLRLDGTGVAVQKQVGKGKIVLMGFHPSAIRDSDAAATSVLIQLISHAPSTPTAWYSWQNTLVLRMDDPGSSETVHHSIYANNKLGHNEWKAIADQLSQRDATLSIGYVAGWVDNGDPTSGTLTVDGALVERVPGKIHDSPQVQFISQDASGCNKHCNYEEEYQSILQLQASGLASVEMHGYTHIHPDKKAWLAASDRYDNERWYREFGRDAVAYYQQANAPSVLSTAKQTLRRYFNSTPSTLICPGEVFTNAVLVDALNEDLMLVSSYYLAIRDAGKFCWAQHICAPYLNQSDSDWFDTDLPVVGYFHDFDISINGVSWFQQCLDDWQAAGAQTIMDFGELNARLCHRLAIQEKDGEVTLTISSNAEFPLRREVDIFLYFPEGKIPRMAKVNYDNRVFDAVITPLSRDTGKITVSPTVGTKIA